MVGMVRTTQIAIALGLTMNCPTVRAQKPEPIALTVGNTAPYSGLLLPPDDYIVLAENENLLEMCLAARVADANLIDELETTCEAAIRVPWYEEPRWNRYLGFAVGIATAVTTFYAASQWTKVLR